MPSIRPPDPARLPAIPTVVELVGAPAALDVDPEELAAPAELVPGVLTGLAAVPAPLGSLPVPELLRPPTLGGAGAPSAELAPAEPTPCAPASDEAAPAAAPLDDAPPADPPPAPPAPPPPPPPCARPLARASGLRFIRLRGTAHRLGSISINPAFFWAADAFVGVMCWPRATPFYQTMMNG